MKAEEQRKEARTWDASGFIRAEVESPVLRYASENPSGLTNS
jgi:hypothetical protein